MTSKYDLKNAEFNIERQSSIWQFRDFLPPVSPKRIVSLGEGWTSYVNASRYGESIGLRNLFCKLEGQNPSGSFKDRIASLGLSLAMEWEKKGVFTASSGNAAAAVSAYAARAGIPSLILIREDASVAKLSQILMYGAKLLRVRDLFKNQVSLMKALELTQQGVPDWLNHFVWAPVNPLLTDALKTIAYELYSQGVPDLVFVPTAGGDLVHGIFAGFYELHALGLIERLPRMVVVQGANANPTVLAIEKGEEKVAESTKAETVAGALRVNFGAEHTLFAVKESEGFGISVTDEEILNAQNQIAKLEGIFTEASSATALAGISKAVKLGKVEKDEKVAAILTGIGFKEFFPPVQDMSQVPLATSPELIPSILKSF